MWESMYTSNPTIESINVSWGNASRQVQSIEIYSLQGQLIKQINGSDTRGISAIEIPVNNLANGSYLLRLSDTKGQYYKLMWSKH